MKIPEELKIGGFTWKIKQDQDISNEGNNFGSTHHSTQQIFIEPKSTVQKKEQCLIHEIMHAIWWQAGMTDRYKTTPGVEEEVIQVLSNGIYQVLNDNGLLIKD